MTRIIIFLFLACLFSLGVYFSIDYYKMSKIKNGKAVLQITSSNKDAAVYIDGNFEGPTPFLKGGLNPGTATVRVENFNYLATLTANTHTFINLDLGPDSFQGFDVLWLEEGSKKLRITTVPDGANIKIDGTDFGASPLTKDDISVGEHEIVISKPGFIQRKISIDIRENFILSMNSNLMKNPLPENIIELISPNPLIKIKDFTTTDATLLADKEKWVAGIAYFFSSIGFESKSKVEYLLDEEGKLYTSEGKLLPIEGYPKVPDAGISIGYLGKSSSDGKISTSAESLLASLATVASAAKSKEIAEVLTTPTGFLRLRATASATGQVLANLNVGEKFPIIGEEGDWYKLRMTNGQEGFASKQYIKKSTGEVVEVKSTPEVTTPIQQSDSSTNDLLPQNLLVDDKVEELDLSKPSN